MNKADIAQNAGMFQLRRMGRAGTGTIEERKNVLSKPSTAPSSNWVCDFVDVDFVEVDFDEVNFTSATLIC